MADLVQHINLNGTILDIPTSVGPTGPTGPTGPGGSNGTSVKVSSISYQAGSSNTVAPTGSWSSTIVAAGQGAYLWTKITFTDNNVAYTVARQGANGTNGTNGTNGANGYTPYIDKTTGN